MLWFFERNKESLRLETRYDNDSKEFVVTVFWSDGRQQTERFTDVELCRTWLTGLEQSLASEHWVMSGSPVVLPHGWPDRPLTNE